MVPRRQKDSSRKKILIVVESPAKARTLQTFLGSQYKILSSNGHIRDLPRTKLGVNIENGFEPHFVLIASKRDVAKKLKEEALKASEVILATDPDREGEAIAWHIEQILCRKVKRVEFHEITKESVLKSLRNPREINQFRVEAQLARRVLDRLVGYGVSPVLWRKVRRGLSAGRVQSVAVRLICEREEQIKSFKSQEYWTIKGIFKSQKATFDAELIEFNGKQIASPDESTSERTKIIGSEAEAREIETALRGLSFSITKIEDKDLSRSPQPPYITASLLQDALRKLGYQSSKTMKLAQRLYEGVEIDGDRIGLITYMRTDSVRVSEAFLAKTRSFIEERFGPNYLPARARKFRSRPGAQEAHEAIRPTKLSLTPDSLRGKIDEDLWKLYDLIFRRFVASQMADAQFYQRTVIVNGTKTGTTATFRRGFRSVVFEGFMKLYSVAEADDGDAEKGSSFDVAATEALMGLSLGAKASLIDIKSEQHFTRPPARYNEATLIKTLEEYGIGRPSTYSPIIDTIIRRGYIVREKKYLRPTEWAFASNLLLKDFFPEIVDLKFTAKMEDGLDKVARGSGKWRELVGTFYFPLNEKIQFALKDKARYKVEPEALDETCPKCGAKLVIKHGRYGKFVSCSNFPSCKYVRKNNNLVATTNRHCPKCSAPIVIRRNRWGIQFSACSTYPKCDFVGEVQENCPKCGMKLLKKRARNRRVFYVCERNTEDEAERCDFIVFGYPTIETCPICGYFLAERRYRGVLQKFCSNSSCDYAQGIEERNVA